MTKRVRIENADAADFAVVVEIWETGEGTPPVLSGTKILSNPGDMTELYIHAHQYFVIKEQ